MTPRSILLLLLTSFLVQFRSSYLLCRYSAQSLRFSLRSALPTSAGSGSSRCEKESCHAGCSAGSII
ncbi:hypothetical protein FCM35_KLT01539 [Carex littledalei]|uniref:Secreted protein n=1 Tax=Carex littledalei TaxID=544730 RepID=A0A833RFN4_9POAL|nr:hypothetical protein FCM35_KLT01539 [Carex littledalei]